MDCAQRLSLISEKIGFTLWQLQDLELVTAQYLALVTDGEKGMGLDEWKKIESKYIKKTFGQTLKLYENSIDKNMKAKFDFILSERNWLVHRSRNDCKSAVYNDFDMLNLLEKFEKIAELSILLIKEIGNLFESHVKKYGVSQESIDKKAQVILKEWHESEI